MKEQQDWAQFENDPNKDTVQSLENLEARTLRYRLQRQILMAVSSPENKSLILEALATYKQWKQSFPEDYENSIYFGILL
jgi:hypothetical protein